MSTQALKGLRRRFDAQSELGERQRGSVRATARNVQRKPCCY